ncbi:MAG: hypothetical protein J3K34DRAFT_473670 [Monoraphidium minutum]|nr:MAG: hypothetical protein J3K34DRAFT_473670 [Monoraphidium minutum]
MQARSAAQSTITLGMGVTSGLVSLPAGLAAGLGFAALPAALPGLVALADKVSIGSAALSCGAGLAAEAVKARREGGDDGAGAPAGGEGRGA